jgi:trehalose synthase
LHNRPQGIAGDGGPLGPNEHAVVKRVAAANAAPLAHRVRAGDVVVLHDPQKVGLVDGMAAGEAVVWRCHAGADEVNGHVEDAWSFLRSYLEPTPSCSLGVRTSTPGCPSPR